MRRPRAGFLLLVAGAIGCGPGSSVTVSGPGPEGEIAVSSQGGSLPPVGAVVDEKGVREPPTPTPGQPTPVYPIETPASGPSPARPTAVPSPAA